MRWQALLSLAASLSTLAAPAVAFGRMPGGQEEMVAEPDPARLAAGRELVALVLPPEQREQVMEAALNAMMRNMIAGLEQGSGLGKMLADDPNKREVFDRFIQRQKALALADIKEAMPSLVEAYARAYARLFTVDEIDQIRAFAATPAGGKFLRRSSEILSDPDVGAWQRRVTAKGAARQMEELERLRKEMGAEPESRKNGQ